MNRILFAGGGTAGHIEPAWAVSQVWKSRHPGDEIAFLGTKSGMEVQFIPERDGKLFLVPKVTAPRSFGLSLFTFPFRWARATSKTISVVKDFDVVVGFGGYVAAVAYLAAAILRKPFVIHEQNAKAGLANRFGALFAKQVAVAYPNSISGAKVVGNPLKAQIVSAALSAQNNWSAARAEAKKRLNVSGPLVLILGGSSGSQAINEVVRSSNFEKYTVIHSVGKDNELPISTQSYRPVKYIDDVATALLAADLVITRSGAIATTEFAALGKYALFIPLPIGNGEQAVNASELVAAHKAEILDQSKFTSEWLNANLPRLIKQGSEPAFGTTLNSAELIADCIERVIR